MTRQTYSAPQSTLDLFYVDSVRAALSEGSLNRRHPMPIGVTVSDPQAAAMGDDVVKKPHRTVSAPTQEKLQTLVKALQSVPRGGANSDDDVNTDNSDDVNTDNSEDDVNTDNSEDEASDNDVYVTRHFGEKRAHSRASLGKARQQFFQPLFETGDADRLQNSPRVLSRSPLGFTM